MTGIVRPRFVALDTSSLNDWSRDWMSADASFRRRARDFGDALQANGYVPFLTLHHLLEMLAHRDEKTLGDRLAFLRDQPVIGTLGSPEAGFGSVCDVLSAEVRAALALADGTAEDVRRRAKEGLVAVVSGPDALAPYAGEWMTMIRMAQEKSERARVIVAVSRATIGENSGKTVRQVLSGNLRPKGERALALEGLRDKLHAEVAECGDSRIEDPKAVATCFFEMAMGDIGAEYENTADLFVQTMVKQNIDPREVALDMLFDDLLELVEFRRKVAVCTEDGAHVAAAAIRRVKEAQIPSWLVHKNLRKHGQDMPERKGSEMTDNFLASALSPYIDLVIVDRRTKENVRRTLQKVPKISSLINRVEKAPKYWDVVSLLAEKAP
jgi:hypothetical protein